MGSLRLSRKLDCLPALDSPDLGNWGIAEIAPECETSVGGGCRLVTAEPEIIKREV